MPSASVPRLKPWPLVGLPLAPVPVYGTPPFTFLLDTTPEPARLSTSPCTPAIVPSLLPNSTASASVFASYTRVPPRLITYGLMMNWLPVAASV